MDGLHVDRNGVLRVGVVPDGDEALDALEKICLLLTSVLTSVRTSVLTSVLSKQVHLLRMLRILPPIRPRTPRHHIRAHAIEGLLPLLCGALELLIAIPVPLEPGPSAILRPQPAIEANGLDGGIVTLEAKDERDAGGLRTLRDEAIEGVGVTLACGVEVGEWHGYSSSSK